MAEQEAAVRHRLITIDGIHVFFREAGPQRAPAVLLPHGYSSCSFQFRHLIPALADRWHVIAVLIRDFLERSMH